MSQTSAETTADDRPAPSRGRLSLAVGLAALAAGGVGVFVLGGEAATPQDTLRAAATDYNNAMIGKAPAKILLDFARTSCTVEERAALTGAPALAKAFAPGVTGFEITKITVTGNAGKVYVQPTGPGAAAIRNITDTGNPDATADNWVLSKGKWFRADC